MPGSTSAGNSARSSKQTSAGLQVQVGLEAHGLAGQGFFHLGQQVAAAEIKFDRIGEFIEGLVLRVAE
jgi:hypothetical protein